MTKPTGFLAALVFGSAVTAAAAVTPEECMDQAARKFHPGAAYLAHKKIMLGSAAAFAVPSTLTLPTSAKNGLHPIFTKSTTGIMTLSSEMPTVYFYDIHPYSVINEGPPLTSNNIDDIGFLTSEKTKDDGGIRPDEARNMNHTPALGTFVQDARTCLKLN